MSETKISSNRTAGRMGRNPFGAPRAGVAEPAELPRRPKSEPLSRDGATGARWIQKSRLRIRLERAAARLIVDLPADSILLGIKTFALLRGVKRPSSRRKASLDI